MKPGTYREQTRGDGCEEVSPTCLTCPLPICKYDDPGVLTRWRRQERDREVIAAMQTMPVEDVARRFGISERTAYRIRLRHTAGLE